jgi:hypothetical protein
LGVVAPYELIVLAVTGHTTFAVQRESVSSVLTLALVDFALVGPLISALYIHAVRAIGNGEEPSLSQVVARGVGALPTVAAAQIVATLGIGIGFVALIVPGVILLIRWAVVAQAAAIENDNWVEALRRSGQLTAGSYLHVLALLLVTGLIAIGLRNIGLSIVGSHSSAGDVTLGIAVETVARSFVALCSAVLFFDLMARRVLRT